MKEDHEFTTALASINEQLAVHLKALIELKQTSTPIDETQRVVDSIGQALNVYAENTRMLTIQIEALVLATTSLSNIVMRQTGATAAEVFEAIEEQTANEAAVELARQMLGAKPRLEVFN